ncbi:MAG: tRNA threonylcarbamoyladenosine dehydratase [Peptococcaceae bacterium]|nr:tRNA threonylcarbamoyladenosine dehydratase [Peptococcaceae bacterium]
MEQFSRTEMLIGPEGLEKLNKSKVLIFGLGGVGSFTTEALARIGIGSFKLVDYDKICLSNLNRQIHALHSTLGRYKVEVMAERIKDINPEAQVETYTTFYTQEQAEFFLQDKPDYVIDAIDTVKSKVSLAVECYRRNIPFISCMGAGNRLDASSFRIADISKTTGDPLAKAVRKLLREEGITQGFKVLFSPQPPLKPRQAESSCSDAVNSDFNSDFPQKRQFPGSVSFVPPVAGLLIAGEVVRDLLGYYD